MLAAGSPVLVGVSGGADSLCLLHALHRLERLFGVSLVCFHFDHRLRPGSERDAEFVRREAAKVGVQFAARAAGGRPRRGESVEAWARDARYSAMAAAAGELGAAEIAVAHTQDDQAETVLMALLRGGGLDALAGMRPVRAAGPDGPPVVRPLLGVTRGETAAFCAGLGLRPRRDPMNSDRAYMRAAVRGGVIPALERATGRGVRATIARTAANLQGDADLLATLEAEAWAATVVRGREGDVVLRARAFTQLHPALGARLARRALRLVGSAPTSRRLQDLLTVAAAAPGTRVSFSPRLLAERRRGYVHLFESNLEDRRDRGHGRSPKDRRSGRG